MKVKIEVGLWDKKTESITWVPLEQATNKTNPISKEPSK